MAYKELKKLYYGDKDTYRETYMRRFASDNAIRLDFDVAGYQAFFVQCEDVIKLSYQILKLDKDILNLRKMLPQVALEQYTRKCLIDEIVLTNNIEGVYSSRKEIGAALNILEEQSEKKGKKKSWRLSETELMTHRYCPEQISELRWEHLVLMQQLSRRILY